ncbi:MAG TPA: hypothetical protein VF727_09670 [Allosphingosinicella sp.]|jgi:ElaB/YqjD/DUF883 family membrane-anchored ribosome-binding protein
MAPREDELPEGTDHIINGAMETGGADDGAGGGFIAGGTGDGTGGTTAGAGGGGGAMATTDTNTGGDASAGGGTGGTRVVEQLRSQASALRDQAGDRVRDFAQGGKTRASDALEELARVVGDTAETIDERLGREYGEYARRAADTVSGVADSLRRKEVDELYRDVEGVIRRSPAVAVGVAAVLGFTVARLIKAGLSPDDTTGGGGASGTGGTRGGEA